MKIRCNDCGMEYDDILENCPSCSCDDDNSSKYNSDEELSFFERIDNLLVNKKFAEASSLLDSFLKYNIDFPESYLYRILIKNKIRGINGLLQSTLDITQDSDYSLLVKYTDEQFKPRLDLYLDTVRKNILNDKCSNIYNSALAQVRCNKYEEAINLFTEILDYKDSKEQLKNACDKFYEKNKRDLAHYLSFADGNSVNTILHNLKVVCGEDYYQKGFHYVHSVVNQKVKSAPIDALKILDSFDSFKDILSLRNRALDKLIHNVDGKINFNYLTEARDELYFYNIYREDDLVRRKLHQVLNFGSIPLLSPFLITVWSIICFCFFSLIYKGTIEVSDFVFDGLNSIGNLALHIGSFIIFRCFKKKVRFNLSSIIIFIFLSICIFLPLLLTGFELDRYNLYLYLVCTNIIVAFITAFIINWKTRRFNKKTE